jgi:hypothetical protein
VCPVTPTPARGTSRERRAGSRGEPGSNAGCVSKPTDSDGGEPDIAHLGSPRRVTISLSHKGSSLLKNSPPGRWETVHDSGAPKSPPASCSNLSIQPGVAPRFDRCSAFFNKWRCPMGAPTGDENDRPGTKVVSTGRQAGAIFRPGWRVTGPEGGREGPGAAWQEATLRTADARCGACQEPDVVGGARRRAGLVAPLS